eukprot:CAMPEP_0174748530 /NCGR_PEP_ID=MMETSP1094-20130205/93696_1 /TAXON_ID=156173 /ORGANISM="Chrysochromulina brevifilum, Strain UTEX LB 985" /LENGTH=99 /DNA_ID=CAMNT_0015953587 /DNA_START=174 /DNA_END=470 /DNA_ORIENTATION=-
MPPATETLRESTNSASASSIATGAMPRGMRTTSVQARRMLVRSPWPSEPRTRTVGFELSSCAGSTLCCSAAPTTCQPESEASVRVRTRLRAAWTWINSI